MEQQIYQADTFQKKYGTTISPLDNIKTKKKKERESHDLIPKGIISRKYI